ITWNRENALDFHARDAPAIHFDDGEAKSAVLKIFSATGDEAELIEHEAAARRVSRILRQRDVVLRVEIAHIQRRVEDNRAVCQFLRSLDDVELVVNFADDLFENIFHRNKPRMLPNSSNT